MHESQIRCLWSLGVATFALNSAVPSVFFPFSHATLADRIGNVPITPPQFGGHSRSLEAQRLPRRTKHRFCAYPRSGLTGFGSWTLTHNTPSWKLRRPADDSCESLRGGAQYQILGFLFKGRGVGRCDYNFTCPVQSGYQTTERKIWDSPLSGPHPPCERPAVDGFCELSAECKLFLIHGKPFY